MNETLAPASAAGCHAGQCDRVPCFRARLQASAAGRRVRRQADLCAGHLGGTVQALTAWARHQGLTGTVIVLAIDPPARGPAGGRSPGGHQTLPAFAFGSITLSPVATPPCPAPGTTAGPMTAPAATTLIH